jgi:nicotinate-nucleotide adenylyltransferase
MRLGVFGGTFDPPHVGHLIVADDVAAALELDRVVFVPTGEHPLKGTRVQAPAPLRWRMIEAATASSERFVVDDREIGRDGPSFTVETLEEIAAANPGAEIFLIVGSDILAELNRWHRVEDIPRLAHVAVMSRAGTEQESQSIAGFDSSRVEVTYVAISSSDIRDRIRTGRPYRYLVPPPVYEIIEENSLYRR